MNAIAKSIAGAALAAALLGCAADGGPARSDEIFARIDPGMTQEQVDRLLGRPDETMRFPLSNTVSWDYRYWDTWGYMAMYHITFGADGRVASKISQRLNDGGEQGSR